MKRGSGSVSAVRTPVGRCRGALAAVGAPQAGRAGYRRGGSPAGASGREEVGGGYLPATWATTTGANLARVVILRLGLPFTVPAITIDRQCSSGLNAIAIGALMIAAGEAVTFWWQGGTESDSNRPHLMEKARVDYQGGAAAVAGSENCPWGAQCLYGYYRQKSGQKVPHHRSAMPSPGEPPKAAAAQAAGRFDAQMIPVTVPGKRGKTTVVDRDECVGRRAPWRLWADCPPP